MLLQSADAAKPQDSFVEREQLQAEDRDNGKRLRRVETRWSTSTFYKRKNDHRNGLREFLLEIPARKIAVVRKQGVDAHGGLLGLNWIDVIFGLAALFADGEDAKRRDCFEWVAGFRVHHAQADVCEVAGVNNRNYQDETD